MTYDKLDNIPLKTFLEIARTGNIALLSNETNPIEPLESIWQRLESEYLELFKGKDETFDLTRRIDTLEAKYQSIILATDSLKFDRNEDLMAMLNKLGYKIKSDSYFDDIEKIERESKSILLKIKRLQQKLPKQEESTETTSIDKVIIGYCKVAGVSYRTNEITVTEFHAVKEIFDDEITNIEKIKAKQKNG